jgi:hypothetical protein
MSVPRIKVKAVAGRIARESPRGAFIPDDLFVSVMATPYIMRLIEVHGDLIVEKEAVEKADAPIPATNGKKE